ncbi:TonB-dependent receptor [Sphingomonas populi]|uniref:TonB-dependent receptor n=1 Tax=Sphingomonas populi TaxID=2484750 RepID=A0A4Q6Y0F5_9SPHN|nr:TonB-dependent receptor [Sphingomonas populi]RZF63652.1 TonB-dependent receptor [Sphingomonas populi]
MKRFRGATTVAGAAIAIWLNMGPAQAQTAPAAVDPAAQEEPATSARGIQDIVVTARKTGAESAQRVPIAITAIPTELIAIAKADDISKVARLAPNTVLESSSTLPGFANFQIRGIGASGSQLSVDPAVGLSVDGMTYDFQGASILDTFDVEGVEILRGPQGILFGANTIGGAVVLRTRRPGAETEAKAEVTIGNLNRFDLSAMLSTPFNADASLRGKIAVLYRTRDGAIQDHNGGTFVPSVNNPSGTEPGTATGNFPQTRTLAIRPTLTWAPPGSAFDMALFGELVRSRGQTSASQPVPGYSAALLTVFGYTPPAGAFEANNNFYEGQRTGAERIALEVNWNIGVGTITSISAFRHTDYHFGFDSDGTPFTILEFPDNRAESYQNSQEIRFASSFSDRVKLLVGAYFDRFDLYNLERRRQGSVLIGARVNTISYIQGQFKELKQTAAAFANVDFKLFDNVTLTAGARYNYDRKSFTSTPLSTCVGPSFDVCSSASQTYVRHWDNISPKAGITWQATPSILAYASYTKGYRSGNFNGRATSFAQVTPADPESAGSSEIGVKSTLFDRRVRFNVAAFNTKYNDIQRQVLVGLLQVITNAASATIRGVEAELTVQPVPQLEFNGNIGYTDAKFETFENLNVNGIPGIQPDDAVLAKKLKFDKVPELNAYAAATYRIPINGRDLALRVDYSYRSSYFTDVLNTPSLKVNGYGTLGASASADLGKVRVTVFGQNLTDARYFDLANTLLVPIRYGGESRTFGMTIGYKI